MRLNFTALGGCLEGLADGSVEGLDPAAYFRIPLNVRDALATLVVRGARLASGRGLAPFVADLGFLVPGAFAGDEPRRREPAINEVGDLGHAQGLAEVDASGMLAVPWPGPAADWTALKAALAARDLVQAPEARILEAAKAHGEAAVARPGFTGAVLLYRGPAGRTLQLEGAVLRGRAEGVAIR